MSATHKKVRTDGTTGQSCAAVDEVVALIGNKWTILVLGVLGKHDVIRYNDLQRAIDGISQRMLTLTLKKLEANGFVKRTVFPTVPARVDYTLTPLGRTLVDPLKGLLNWVTANQVAMAEARAAYAKVSKKT